MQWIGFYGNIDTGWTGNKSPIKNGKITMVSGEDYPNQSIEILMSLLNGRSPGSDLLEVRVYVPYVWPYELEGYPLKFRPKK